MTYSPSELRDAHGRWTHTGAVAHILKKLGHKHGTEGRQAVAVGEVPDTKTLHQVGGKYTPERAAEHKRIIEHFLASGIARPQGSSPDAIFTAGGPASGKSGLAGRAKDPSHNLPTPRGHVYINPDDIKEHIREYQMLKDAGRDDIAAGAVHEESSDIAKQLTREAMAHNMPLVIDGVGDSERGKFAGKVRSAQRSGYNVTVRYAHTSLPEAQRREVVRAQETGRKVEEGYLTQAHAEVSRRFRQIRKMPGVRVEIHNTGSTGQRGLIAVRDPHLGVGMHVINRPAYNEFKAKAKPGRGR